MPSILAARSLRLAARAIRLAALALLLVIAAVAQTGRWEGSIELPGQSLAMTVDLLQQADGWQGTIDIPAQGARNFALGDVKVEQGQVSFKLTGVPGEPQFLGKIGESGDLMKGTFSQAGTRFPFTVTLNDSVEAADLGPSQIRPAPEGIPGEGLEGVWLGVLDGGVVDLRLVARFSLDDAGAWQRTVDSIDQGAAGLEIKTIEFDGETLKFELRRPQAGYEGRMSADGSTLAGAWSQNGREMPLDFKRQAGEPELARPQEPKRPFPYREEQVEYRNPDAGVTFAGTLTLPKGEGPFPAVLLLTGSGPQDRDETIMGHKPFLVLSDHLTRRGFAVLRADDRGVGGSSGNLTQVDTSMLAGDALAGLAFLRARAEVDPKRVGLVGHSEGAMVATLAASQSADIAFVVGLAHPGLVGEELIYLQSKLMMRNVPGGPQMAEANQKLQARIFEVVKSEPNLEKATDRIRAVVEDDIDEIAQGQPAEIVAAIKQSAVAIVVNPWFRSFLTFDPVKALSGVSRPLLLLFGEYDLQVPPDANSPPLRAALETSGHADFEIAILPKLNHLFQTSQSGMPQEYASIEETFAPAALDRIAHWLEQKSSADPKP